MQKNYQPVGFGYGMGPGRTRTAGYCKMGVSFADCMAQCDKESHCNGFDVELEWNPGVQCCIRTGSFRTVPGWQSFRGHGAPRVTQGTTWKDKRRIVMAKNQFIRV